MTEEEWFACEDVARMLEFLGAAFGPRERRLFACACCRRFWAMLPEEACREAIIVAEEFADDRADTAALNAAYVSARRAFEQVYYHGPVGSDYTLPEVVTCLVDTQGDAADCIVGGVFWLHHGMKELGSRMLREVTGNPFRLCRSDNRWHTPDVVSLSDSAYIERHPESGFLDNARLAVLSDALEEAGCDSEILHHLRSPGPHVRGCWAVDLILGKR